MFGCMAATDPTCQNAKLALLHNVPVCVIYGTTKHSIDDRLGGEHAPKHAAATMAALPKTTPAQLIDLRAAPLVGADGTLNRNVRTFLESSSAR